jgi:hypothetical protein
VVSIEYTHDSVVSKLTQSPAGAAIVIVAPGVLVALLPVPVVVGALLKLL